jgi:hypothetical protein
MGAGQNGTVCNDGNGCTQVDTCQGGTCTGASPVACAASDSCHTPGTCTSTGATSHSCSNPVATDGTTCGTNETCKSGACGCSAAFPTTCSGVCVDTTSDKENCGSCGHPCQGGTCVGSQCQPVVVGMFSDTPTDFAIDLNFAYAVINGAANAGLVEKCALTGCASGAGVVASGQPQYMLSVTTSSAGVFWTGLESSGGSAAGCAPATCANGVVTYLTSPSEQPYTIAADGTNVYYSLLNNNSGVGFQGIQTCPVGGCPSSGPTTFAGGNAPYALTPYFLADAAGFVFWTDALDPSSLKKCSVNGCAGTPANLATSPSSDFYQHVVADAANVYWLDQTSDVAYECPITGCPGGAPIPLGTAASALAIDSSNVYWAGSGPSLVKCAIGGCGSNPTTVLPSIAVNPPIFQVSSTTIYWLNGATLMKVAK